MIINNTKFRAIRIYAFMVGLICCGFISGCKLASLETSRQQVGSWGQYSKPSKPPPAEDEALPSQSVVSEPVVVPPPASIEPTKMEKRSGGLPEPPVVPLTTDWLAKSDTSIRYGEWAEAIRTASAAIHRNPEALKAYINRSFAYNQKELFTLAMADADKAFLLDPLNVLALVNRCYAKGHIGQLKEAQDDCLSAIDLSPDFSMPYNIMGFIREKEGHLREAELYYEMSCGLKNSAGCENKLRVSSPVPKHE